MKLATVELLLLFAGGNAQRLANSYGQHLHVDFLDLTQR